MKTRTLLLASLALVGFAQPSPTARAPEVPYPDGFRRWAHVKSSLSAPEGDADPRSGIRHIYANEQALRGYATGRFADGSIIVFDVLDVTTANGTTREGARKLVDVMHKDSARFAATGGWGYEEFRGDTRERLVRERAPTACFQCHTQRKESDYVFSRLRP
jgi:hypothetical protein